MQTADATLQPIDPDAESCNDKKAFKQIKTQPYQIDHSWPMVHFVAALQHTGQNYHIWAPPKRVGGYQPQLNESNEKYITIDCTVPAPCGDGLA